MKFVVLGPLLEPSLIKVYKSRKLVLFEDVWAGGYVTFVKALGSGDIYGFGLNNYCQLGKNFELLLCFWSASLWDLTHLKDKSDVWVEPMLRVLGDPKFLGKRPYCRKETI